MYRSVRSRLVAVASFGLTSLCTGVLAVSPPPDGGYPNQNTAEGEDALFSLTIGSDNTAVGYHALHNITDSSGNTAIGNNALANATAGPNTAVGYIALQNNTIGYNNTAVDGLYANTTGHDNTAVGAYALAQNTTGSFNTAVGVGACDVGNGDENCAFGSDALQNVGGGTRNVAIGEFALEDGAGGQQNVAVGYQALTNSKGNHNIAIGASAGSFLQQGDGNIDLGNTGSNRDKYTIRIGQAGTHTATFIAGISGVTVPNGVAVMVGPDGKLGTLTSSGRFKDRIEPMGNASDKILSLQPVTFRYKQEIDPAAIPQYGLVAEQVEKVAPELVARDAQGKPYSVRYEAVNAMLLNEFLKEHRKSEERGAVIEKQRKRIEQLEAATAKLEAAIENAQE